MIDEITNFLKENKLLVIMIIGYLVLSKTKETFTSTFDKDISEIKIKKTDYDKDINKITLRIADLESAVETKKNNIIDNIEKIKTFKTSIKRKTEEIKEQTKIVNLAERNKDELFKDYQDELQKMLSDKEEIKEKRRTFKENHQKILTEKENLKIALEKLNEDKRNLVTNKEIYSCKNCDKMNEYDNIKDNCEKSFKVKLLNSDIKRRRKLQVRRIIIDLKLYINNIENKTADIEKTKLKIKEIERNILNFIKGNENEIDVYTLRSLRSKIIDIYSSIKNKDNSKFEEITNHITGLEEISKDIIQYYDFKCEKNICDMCINLQKNLLMKKVCQKKSALPDERKGHIEKCNKWKSILDSYKKGILNGTSDIKAVKNQLNGPNNVGLDKEIFRYIKENELDYDVYTGNIISKHIIKHITNFNNKNIVDDSDTVKDHINSLKSLISKIKKHYKFKCYTSKKENL